VRLGRIRALRQAFDTADVDDDDAVDREELKTVIVALNPRPVSTADLDLLWGVLNPEDKPTLSWTDFLQGIASVRKDGTAREIMGLATPNQWDLISLLVDLKIQKEEEQELLSGLSFFTASGVKTLQRKQSKELTKAEYTAVLQKVANGQLRNIKKEQADNIVRFHRRVGWLAFLIGLVMNCIFGAWDTYVKYSLDSDGTYSVQSRCHSDSAICPGFWIDV